jgi:hypothetical protein
LTSCGIAASFWNDNRIGGTGRLALGAEDVLHQFGYCFEGLAAADVVYELSSVLPLVMRQGLRCVRLVHCRRHAGIARARLEPRALLRRLLHFGS